MGKSKYNQEQYRNLQLQIQAFKKGIFPRSDTFTLCTLPNLLNKVGYVNKNITFDQRHMREITDNEYWDKQIRECKNTNEKQSLIKGKENHLLGEEFLYKLPSLLEKPIAIIRSNTNGEKRELMILDYSKSYIDKWTKRENEKYIVVAIDRNGFAITNGKRKKSTHIYSMYYKETAQFMLGKRIEDEYLKNKGDTTHYLYYIDIKKATKVLDGKSFALLRWSNPSGLIHNINENKSDVKK